MVSERKLAANRRNAQRSTGPRTPRGKAVSSLNATRHGLASSSPVVPSLEDSAAWEVHRDDTVAALAPVGRLETTLAERVALILWRLDRVTRFEREMTSLEQETAPDHLVDAKYSILTDSRLPERTRDNLPILRARMRALTRFDALPPDGILTGARAAEHILWAIDEQLPDFDLSTFSAPKVAPDGIPFDELPGWTAARLDNLIRAIAESRGLQPDDLLDDTIVRTRDLLAEHQVTARGLARNLDHLRRERILARPGKLGRVMRYESHLGRQLAQTLAHLGQLQKARPARESPTNTLAPSR